MQLTGRVPTAFATMLGSLVLFAGVAQAEPSSPPGAHESARADERESADHTDVAAGRAALQHYEGLRAALAKDALGSVGKQAASLEKAARALAKSAPPALRGKWRGIAEAAKHLGSVAGNDAAAVRKAFGGLSEQVVALLTADRALADGFHLFECPMAQGYKKWVQPTPAIGNPYMGPSMLSCGSEHPF